MRVSLLCLTLVMLAGCRQQPSYTSAQTAKWVRQCGGQLIADAKAFYDSTSADLSEGELEQRIEGFYATAGRLLTLKTQLDAEGRPVGLELRPNFWDNTQVSVEQRQQWQRDTRRLVAGIEVSLGLRLPAEVQGSSQMLQSWLGDAAFRLDMENLQVPFTLALRRVQDPFLGRKDLNWFREQ